jgi:hypothetical protein
MGPPGAGRDGNGGAAGRGQWSGDAVSRGTGTVGAGKRRTRLIVVGLAVLAAAAELIPAR